MKYIIMLSVLLLSACAPSAEAIQQAIAETQAAAVTPTRTPKPTNTPKPTSTRGPTRTPRPTRTPEPASLRNPAPLGDTLNLVYDNGVEFSLTVIDVVRGEEALDLVMDSNQFNEAPNDGMEYLVATIDVAHTGTDDEILEMNTVKWSVLTNQRVFDWMNSAMPCCFEDLKLASGGQADLIIALQVFIDDNSPLLVFEDKFYFETN